MNDVVKCLEAPLDVFGHFGWYRVMCVSGPERFLPGGQSFAMRVAQLV